MQYQYVETPTEINEYRASSHIDTKSIPVKPQSTEILEGTVMALNTADEMYEPYDADGDDGLGVPAIILDERVAADSSATPIAVNCNALFHGRVDDSKIICDGSAGADAATKAALPQVFFDANA